MKTIRDFIVIDIDDENDTYLALLEFEWENDNKAIINLKRGEMSFEVYGTRVIQPLDIIEGEQYTWHVDDIMDGAIVE
jgi:hypothetical protein